MDTEEMLQRLRAGDERAFRFIYDQYYGLLCRFANQLLHDTAVAEEIVDDVVFNLWLHHEDIEITCSLRAYLLRSVRNRCLNELNSASRRKELSLSSLSNEDNMAFLDYLFADDSHPLGELIERELESELRKAIEALPAECRVVFKKSRIECKKYEEIASELGISVNTVKYHMKHALSILYKRFGQYLEVLLIYFFN